MNKQKHNEKYKRHLKKFVLILQMQVPKAVCEYHTYVLISHNKQAIFKISTWSYYRMFHVKLI